MVVAGWHWKQEQVILASGEAGGEGGAAGGLVGPGFEQELEAVVVEGMCWEAGVGQEAGKLLCLWGPLGNQG